MVVWAFGIPGERVTGGYGYGSNSYQGSEIQAQMSLMYTTGLFSSAEQEAMHGQDKTEAAGSLYKGSWEASELTSSDIFEEIVKSESSFSICSISSSKSATNAVALFEI